MAKKKATYKSYLLRVWWDEENGRVRIHLEEVKEKSQILHFADVDTFIGFLLSEPQHSELPGSGAKNTRGEQPMSTEQNKALAHQFLEEVLNQGNMGQHGDDGAAGDNART